MIALGLAGCANYGPQGAEARTRPVIWNRNADTNPEAAKVQQIAAQSGKQARCKSDTEQRQGTDGTSPRDYKCKGPKQ